MGRPLRAVPRPHTAAQGRAQPRGGSRRTFVGHRDLSLWAPDWKLRHQEAARQPLLGGPEAGLLWDGLCQGRCRGGRAEAIPVRLQAAL